MPRQSFCLNHVERPATANCQQCHRPLCTECRVPHEGQVFCSGGCQERFLGFYSGGVFRSKPSLLSRVLPPILLLALLLGGVYAAGAYGDIPWARSLLEQLGLLKK